MFRKEFVLHRFFLVTLFSYFDKRGITVAWLIISINDHIADIQFNLCYRPLVSTDKQRDITS